jgi:hypothetical protein
MPLLKYFGSAGTALLLLLFGLNWLVPQTAEGPVRSGVDRTVIRISSVERLPERVTIDTSLPTIVPPPNLVDNPQQRTQSAFIEISPHQAVLDADHVTTKKQGRTKREPLNKVAVQRAPPTVRNEPPAYHSVEAAAPVIRISLLDILKERLGQSLFKLN